MSPRSTRSLAGSPLLIGAVTTLVVIVAVFLSYNANNGLPFVPTYDIKVTLPDTNSLQVGNDVRVGGTRVGSVSAEAVKQNPHTGAVMALVTVKLEKRLQEIPANSTVIVRNRSALGSKYLEITLGNSIRKVPPGGTLPLSQATPQPVEIDQVLNMFNAPTRVAQQTNLEVYGDTFAGRGGNLNNTIYNLAPSLANLQPLLRTLAAPSTHLAGFFKALERASAQTAPVAQQNAQVFVDLDTTFKALAGVAPSIAQATNDGPASLDQAIHSLVFERPFIRQLTRFFSLLQPTSVALRGAAPSLGPAVVAGVRNLPVATEANAKLSTTLAQLAAFAQNPGVTGGVYDLTTTATYGSPLFQDLGNMQQLCNYPTLLVRNFASALAEGSSIGTWLRAGPLFDNGVYFPTVTASNPAPTTAAQAQARTFFPTNALGSPSSAPANGGVNQQGPPSAQVSLQNHLATNPYPIVGAPGQPKKCVAGNEIYTQGKTVIGNPARSNNYTDFTVGK
jgi:virulence factor Mce-like protein